jgi:glycosyltransferase involved in cell wall biosynthesis
MAHLCFLVTGHHDPSARFRVGTYRSRFRAAGHRADVHVLPRSRTERSRLFRNLGGADSVILLRRLLVPWETWQLRRHARRLVFEYDDALTCRDTGRGAGRSWARVVKFATVVRAADAVVAGNDHLASLARRYRHDVDVIPTVVDPEAYPLRTAPDATAKSGPPVVGWIGTASNFPYLVPVAHALAQLVRERACRLRIMAETAPTLPGLDRSGFEFVPWEESTEASFLWSLDVGLMPLVDDTWSRGKCGLKALQYMATGVPVVAPDVGSTAALVDSGGLIVASGEDWTPALGRLLADPALRQQLGHAGRQRVIEAFAPDVWYPDLERCYLGHAGRTARVGPRDSSPPDRGETS